MPVSISNDKYKQSMVRIRQSLGYPFFSFTLTKQTLVAKEAQKERRYRQGQGQASPERRKRKKKKVSQAVTTPPTVAATTLPLEALLTAGVGLGRATWVVIAN